MAGKLAVAGAGRGVRARGDMVATTALLEFQWPTAKLIARSVPFRGRITIWVIFAMVASVMTVAGVIPVDRVVTANGRVISRAGTLVVQPLETSIVRAILVQEGQVVHAGEILAKLDPTFTAADVGTYQAQAVSLQAEVDRLRAEVQDRPYVSDGTLAGQFQSTIYGQRKAEYDFKLSNYREKIASLQSAVVRSLGDVKAYTARLDGALQVEGMRKELERLNAGSKLNTLQAIDSRLDIQSKLETPRNQVGSTTSDLKAMTLERDGFVEQHRSENSQLITDQERKLSDAREQLNKAALRHQLIDLRAGQDSVVQKIADVSVGSVLQSGDQFMTLVPSDAQLEIEANVAGRDAGFVHPGDPVSIKFDTFDYVLYGSAKGTVRTVSADSYNNSTVDRSKAVTRPSQQEDDSGLGPVYYKARVTLDEIKLHDLPLSFRMTPGMPVNADIRVGQRTILGYLLGRIIPGASQGIREP